ncbi:phosphatase PAP2 family protein [Actinomadura sp. HBU206391]|uniref:phosphatase PAP2 family protein n=1 Tax=Actinomadura sp. HBU206391 TaxID=2731692 RepID=UPI00164F97EC|nr:lysylphosphatidylglycerol synthase domain-containing protein [Actinomadura sp. HBU206391]MBC6462812.1 phosphatase PAP2 family protein [Actinomadura sp. HBU206391]
MTTLSKPPQAGTAALPATPPTRRGARRRVWLRRTVSLTVVGIVFGGVLPRLVDFEAVAGIFSSRVGHAELAVLAALTLTSVLASAVGLIAGLPGLRLSEACAVNVVTTALAYALPGGAAAGTALNVSMLQELGFTPRPIALQVLSTGLWNLGVRLILPLLALGLLGLASDVPAEARVAGVAGLILATILISLTIALLRWDRPARLLGSALARLSRRLPGRHEVRADRAVLLQTEAGDLIRRRWPLLTVSALAYQVTLFGVLYASLQIAGASQVGALEAFAVYAVARQATVLPLTPGSAGILELALIGGLQLGGAELEAATAGVLLFRFFTYLLYLPAAGPIWLWWRFRRRHPARPRPVFRHPADALRLAAGGLSLLVLILLSRDVAGLDADLFRLVNDVPDAAYVPIWLVMQAGWIGMAGLASVAALLARRGRLAVNLLLAGGCAWLLAKVVKDIAGRPRPAALLDEVILRADAGAGGTGFVAGHAAVAAALATVASVSLPRPYRRWLWVTVAAVGLGRVYVGAHFPLDLAGGVVVGWMAGSAVLLLRGTPARPPDAARIRAGLSRLGITAASIHRTTGDLRRAVPFEVTTTTGERFFVKAVGRDQRDADWLHRVWQWLGPAPSRPMPFATPKHQLEHEAYLLMLADRAGVRTPLVRFTADIGDDTWILAMDAVDGRPLAGSTSAGEGLPRTNEPAACDDLLDELWRQLGLLARDRLAHRDLRPHNIVIDGTGLPWIVGFGAAEADATPAVIRADAARMLTLTADAMGSARAVAAAVRALGQAETAALAPLLRRCHRDLLPPSGPVAADLASAVPATTAATRRRRGVRGPAALPPASARHPGDVIRVVLGLGLGLTLSVLAAGGFLLQVEADLFRVVNRLPGWLFGPVNLVMQAGSLAAVGVAAGGALLALRRRLAVDFLIGGSLAWLLAKAVKSVADRGRPGALLSEVVLRGAGEGGLGFVSGHAAVAVALATVASAHVRRPVRWALWAIAGAVALGRMYVGAHFPLDVVAGMGLGCAIGGAVHLIRGTPAHLPTPAQVARGLARCGLGRMTVTPLNVDARGSVPFTAVTVTGRRVFVKALGRDQRDADLLFKLTRFLVYRDLEDEFPFASPKRQIEHEAYMLMRAERAGVRVPGFLGVAGAGSGTWILAEQAVAVGADLAGTIACPLQVTYLQALWGEIGKLRAARIAHRDLRLANMLIAEDGKPVLVDFGFAEDGASDQRLAQDVAELLVSTAFVVGPRQAVRAAVDTLGPTVLCGVSSLLQPLALARSTRQELRGRPRLLNSLRREIAVVEGAPTVPEPLTRAPSRPWVLLLLLGAALAVYQVLIGIVSVRHPTDVLSDTNPRWLIVAALLVAASYAAGALSLMGASSRHLALGRTYLHQVAASYVSRQHRAGLGADAVLGSYLRSAGASREEAVQAVALTRLTGGLVHAIALGLACSAALLEARDVLTAPRWSAAPVALPAVAAALIGAVLLLRRRNEVAAPLRGALLALPARLRRPREFAMLLFGTSAVTSCSVLAFLAVAQAMGVSVSPVLLAASFLTVMPLRLLGPLPGGLGVVEPILTLVLVALGAGGTEAVLTVVVFRVLGFWLPVLPGAVAFHRTGRYARLDRARQR